MAEYKNNLCEKCGYDLSGLTPVHCPECGFLVHRYTQRLREVMVVANQKAIDMFSGKCANQRLARWWLPSSALVPSIYPLHLLIGLATGPSGVAQAVLVRSGVTLSSLVHDTEAGAPRISRANLSNIARLRLHPSSAHVVRAGVNAAMELKHTWVGTEHLLIGLFDAGDQLCKSLLSRHGADRHKCIELIQQNLSAIHIDAP